MNKKFLMAAAVAVSMAQYGVLGYADTIVSEQFPQFGRVLHSNTGYQPNYTAGVVNVNNWNCATDVPNRPGNGVYTSTASGLYDSTGVATGIGYTLHFTAADNAANSFPAAPDFWVSTGNADTILAGASAFSSAVYDYGNNQWTQGALSLSFSGLSPTGTYDVIAYVAAPEWGNPSSGSVTVNGITTNITTASNLSVWQLPTAGNSNVGNYVRFDDVAGSTLLANPLQMVIFNGGNMGLSGFQIIKLEAPPTPTWTWNSASSGDWTGSTWAHLGSATGAPNGVGQVVTLGNAITGNRTVYMDSDVTVGSLTIDSATNGYNLSGWGNLKIDNTGGTGNAVLNVVSGSHRIGTTTVEFASTTDLTVASGAALVINSIGGVVVDAGVTVNKAIGGTLTVMGNIHVATGGSFVLANNASPLTAAPLAAGSVSVTGTGKVDLGNNSAILHKTTEADVETLLKNGGLTSGTALATAALGELTGSTYLALHGSSATFHGQTVLASDVLVGYTYAGDTTLKGYIDATDFAQIDAAYLKGTFTTSGAHWINGDFNHDGAITPADFALMDAAYYSQTGGGGLAADLVAADMARFAGTDFSGVYQAALAGASPSTVPEPASLGLLAIGALGLLGRRR